jgi:hypothetical protein
LDDADEKNAMTFDDSGKFVSIKELKSKKTTHEESVKTNFFATTNENDSKKEKTLKLESNEQSEIIEKIEEPSIKNEPDVEVSESKDDIEQAESISKNTESIQEKNVESTLVSSEIINNQFQVEDTLNVTSQKLNKISLNEV